MQEQPSHSVDSVNRRLQVKEVSDTVSGSQIFLPHKPKTQRWIRKESYKQQLALSFFLWLTRKKEGKVLCEL